VKPLRVVVLDGLDWEWCSGPGREVAAPLWALADRGCCAPLLACRDPITPPAVAALLCGREVPLDWARTRGSYATSHDLVRARPWFRALAAESLTVGLCGIPLTWPAFPLPRGSWMVSGPPMPSPARSWRYPDTLDAFRCPVPRLAGAEPPGGSSNVEALAALETHIVDWFFADAPRADLEILWLRATDAAGHHAWGTDAYTETVRATVAHVEALAKDASDLVVISDHGFCGISEPRAAAYLAGEHGRVAVAAGLKGAHAPVGVLFAAGERIQARGVLPEQRLVEVAGGLFDLLQVPPPSGMVSIGPAWASPVSADEAAEIGLALKQAGYST